MKYAKQRIDIPSVEIADIDLGCGNKWGERVGIDNIDFGQAVVWDLRLGIPLPDNSVAKIYSSHFFEHVEPKDLFLLFNEMYRVGKNGCEIHIVVPHKDGSRGYILTHLTEWSEQRVEEILAGLYDCGENWFKFKEMYRYGIELHFLLEVNK